MSEKLKDRNGVRASQTVTTYEFPMKPVERSFWETVYNSEKGTVFGRNSKGWFQLFVFYAIFYIVLASLFTICMQGLLSTISKDYPTWQLDASLIGTNPGMGFRPLPDRVEEGSLIWYEPANQTQVMVYVNALDGFLENYIDSKTLPNRGQNQITCGFNTPPGPGQVCALDVSKWAPCTSEEGYGYARSSPCVFLKLNRIYGWYPEFYDDVNDLPSDMPTDLVDYIASLPVENRRQIWVSCKGENPHDTETVGPIEYVPERGFPAYFYPFQNTPGYLSPLVAVKFARPALHRIINIECRAWAKNIIYAGGRDRTGSIHFELMIDAE